jgi:DNA-binding NarL/FixJ family response regulator
VSPSERTDTLTTVLVVDDDELVRAGLRVIIDAEPDLRVVAECGDGLEVAALVTRHRPDVVLMDVRMPGIDGIATTRHLLTGADVPPKVLVLTTFGTDAVVHDALRVGAAGFLVKRARAEEIVQAVRTVARGESLVFPATIRGLAPASTAATSAERAASAGLTDREYQVLTELARGGSNAEIAVALGVGVETVKTHLAALLRKLGSRDRTQAVVAAYRRGLVPPE